MMRRIGSPRATDGGPVSHPRLEVRAKRLLFRMKTEGGLEPHGMGWQFAIVNRERVPTTSDEAPLVSFPHSAQMGLSIRRVSSISVDEAQTVVPGDEASDDIGATSGGYAL